MNFRARAEREEREAEERARREAYERSPEGRIARLSSLGRESYEQFRLSICAWDWEFVARCAIERGSFELGDEVELRSYDVLEETAAAQRGFEAALTEAAGRFGLQVSVPKSNPREGRTFRVTPIAEGDDHGRPTERAAAADPAAGL